ncbi:HmuY family protein [Anditalea andensis]|uniref:HmuY protein n=1 Tax=Anditalea andensis TaxID=1048983 RepID=A0A074LEF1_9BACT|nr:HmuY family protein [Anditalea andensis]KEO72142.1 hypothetical protein EL17_19730 [Anditalea andensis]
MKKQIQLLSLMSLLALTISCEKQKDNDPVVQLDAVVVENIHAPGDVINRTTGQVEQENPFRYYSLETNTEVNNADQNWDIGFKGTTIIVNSGVSGPGNASAAMMQGTFEETREVPTGLDFRSDSQSEFAIPTGSGNGWYNYNSSSHIISPVPGRILLVKTNGGKYAKVEILSYYKDNPPISEVNAMTTPGSYYTFQYILQPDGSKSF